MLQDSIEEIIIIRQTLLRHLTCIMTQDEIVYYP